MPPLPTPAQVSQNPEAFDLAVAGAETEAIVRAIQKIKIADKAYKMAMAATELRDVRIGYDIVDNRDKEVRPNKPIALQDRAIININLIDTDTNQKITIQVGSTEDTSTQSTSNIFTIDADQDDAHPEDTYLEDTLGEAPEHILAAGDETILIDDPTPPPPNPKTLKPQTDIDMEDLLAGFAIPPEPAIKITDAEMREALKARQDKKNQSNTIRDLKMPDFDIALNRHFT